MNSHWTDADYSAIAQANSFSELLPTALTVVRRMPRPVAMVSGPMSTGGAGSLEKNIKRFSQAVTALATAETLVFDQMPFQDAMMRLLKKHSHESSYYMPLLEDFYLPLFESGLIKKVFFLPDWQTSVGASWERKQCERLGITIEEYPAALLDV